MACKHKTIFNHVPHGIIKKPQTWVCSICKIWFKWSDKASYFGNMECPKCQATRIDAVVCSDACRKAYDQKTRRKK